jgi:hypothetical protein
VFFRQYDGLDRSNSGKGGGGYEGGKGHVFYKRNETHGFPSLWHESWRTVSAAQHDIDLELLITFIGFIGRQAKCSKMQHEQAYFCSLFTDYIGRLGLRAPL